MKINYQINQRRRTLRLKKYGYDQEGAYFVTICVKNRECLFGEIINGAMQINDFGRVVEEEWLRTAEVRASVLLDAFIVMPNHFHGIFFLRANLGATPRVAPTEGRPSGGLKPGSVGAIMAQFKSLAAKRINALRRTPGLPLWQRNYYDHVIRDEEDLNRIRQYILNNPARWLEDENNPKNR